ncbi:MAG: methyltransferase [Gemmatimonadota bacterium]|nr:methyltransferase [Gemmatimonadota bacterium]
MRMIFGRWRSQILYAGVKLGTFEAVTGEERTADEVAEELELDPANTYRLMRALGSLGLLDERGDGQFRITEKGRVLTREHPQSLRGVALLEESPEHYALWTHLPEFIRTGEQDAFEEEHGYKLFEYPEADAEYSRVFDEAMTSYSRVETKAVLEALDEETLAGVDHLCDVAGGYGYLLAHLLQEHPNLTGEVLEMPKVVEEAGQIPGELGVADRIRFTAGNMFEAVPEADAYLMKHILHDWNDAECVEILENIREAAPHGAPVFVAELVVPGPRTPHFAKLFDIHMMVATTGRERTVEEYGELFRRAGLEPAGHHRSESLPMSVVEGRVG